MCDSEKKITDTLDFIIAMYKNTVAVWFVTETTQAAIHYGLFIKMGQYSVV